MQVPRTDLFEIVGDEIRAKAATAITTVTAAAPIAFIVSASDGVNPPVISNFDLIFDSAIDDVIWGTDAADTINGTAANEMILGGLGADTITTGTGDDTIDAGNGTNNVTDAGGTNSVTTGNGGDTIVISGDGNNTVRAGAVLDRASPANRMLRSWQALQAL